ncbi:MFS transporter [Nocardia asteroides]|uniref:MFS transporter n=1 Tax=Nocardia asteroides TaxID=1824 RepID=UPI0037CC123B
MGIFLMGTTEFMVAGLLPDLAVDLNVDIAHAGLLVTAFAAGMIVGPPVMALATVRCPARATLIGALVVFAVGHVVAAVSGSFVVIVASRVVTALATGTFWATGAVVAVAGAGAAASARALSVLAAGLSSAMVAGVPLGALAGQLAGWRGPFWMLAALAGLAIVAVARFVLDDVVDGSDSCSVRSEIMAVRPWRVWVVLAATALAQAGVLSAYSFISALLTDRAGLRAALVPLVLVGFGLGTSVGAWLGGRLGDRWPLGTIAVAVAVSSLLLLALAAIASHAGLTVAVVVMLGATGLGANPVLIAQTLRFAGAGSRLASSLATAAFNVGTAAGSAIAAAALATPLGASGPAVLGGVISATALIPLSILALNPPSLRTPP